MICVLLSCEKHPMYSLKSMQETPNNNPIRIGVCLKLLIRIRIELGNILYSHYSELKSRYSETTFCRLTDFGTYYFLW